MGFRAWVFMIVFCFIRPDIGEKVDLVKFQGKSEFLKKKLNMFSSLV